MEPFDPWDFLERLAARGIRGRRVDDTLVFPGAEPVDQECIRRHPRELAHALANPRPVAAPGEDDASATIATPEPEPDPIVEVPWFPTEQRIPLGGNRVRHVITSKRRLELSDVLDYLDAVGDREAFDKGQISKQHAFEAAGRWYRHRKALADAIVSTLQGDVW